MLRYSTIKKYDVANGRGIRTSIFFNGCAGFNGHHCYGCFNHDIWDFKGGNEFDDNAKKTLFEYLSDPHVFGLSVLGGEPLQQDYELLSNLLKEVKENFPNKDIWLWTGYYLNELNEHQKNIIDLCDYVIDGRFEIDKKDKNIKFRGSTNQTIWMKNENGEFIKSDLN